MIVLVSKSEVSILVEIWKVIFFPSTQCNVLHTAIEYLTVIFCQLAFSTRSRPLMKITDGLGFVI